MDKQANRTAFNPILDELLNEDKIKEKDARKKLDQLKGLMPAQSNPYRPSGRVDSKKLPVFIIGMLITGALFIPLFDSYVGFIQGYLEGSGSELRGVDYGGYAGKTFYLIGGLLILHIVVSVFGVSFLGTFTLCRNEKVALAVSFLPTAVIILYLQTTASSYFRTEGYSGFVSILSILVFISSLVVLLAVYNSYTDSHMFDEHCGKFLKRWTSPKLSIWVVNDLLQAVQSRNEEDLLKIVEAASLSSAESKTRESGASHFQIYVTKLPSDHEYQYGYIQGIVFISLTARGNKNVTKVWSFMFEKMDKALIEKLYASLKKLALIKVGASGTPVGVDEPKKETGDSFGVAPLGQATCTKCAKAFEDHTYLNDVAGVGYLCSSCTMEILTARKA